MSPRDPLPTDDVRQPDAGPLTPRQRWGLSLAGGILGAIIGPSGFLLQMRLSTWRATGEDLVRFPGSPARWADAIAAIGKVGALQLFILFGFVATAAIMPRLVAWIEARVDRPARAYYTSAAAGGVVLGFVATFFVAWMLAVAALVVGLATGSPAPGLGTGALALFGGALVFGPLVGLFTPFFFVLPIVGIGIPLGLGYGVIVRRLARPRRSVPSQEPARAR